MPIHNFSKLEGRIETIEIDSQAISNNVLGDPNTRQVAVYLPSGYDDSDQDYPLMVDIVGYTGSGLAHVGWKAYGESVPQRVERLIAEGKMGPVIVAFPDCFTSLGGNQYINSSVMGNWADFLTAEMIPALEGQFRIKADRSHRAIFGKSSGGYGAMIHGMLYVDYWGAIACHSGDMAFDLVYKGDMPKTAMHLGAFGGNIRAFLDRLGEKRKLGGNDFHTLMILAMAATYDPAPELPYGVRLPVDLETCELDEVLWQNWLNWDPVHLIKKPEVQANLKRLSGLFIDCGDKDQYALIFGARQLTREFDGCKIEHRYEEFADNHSSVDYRMDESLPFLYNKIQ